jgi:ABC-2 type transport system permease protein
MSHLLDVYRTQFRTTMIAQLQYRAAVLIWLIEMVLEPLVYLIVWGTVATASGGSLGTYTSGDFAAYYVIFMVVNHLTFTWIMWEYEYRVRQGTFSSILLRPVHPIHADISDNVAYKVLTSAIMLPTAAALWLVFHATANPPLWAVLAFLPALFLSFVARFLLEWTLATAAFWTTRTDALNQVYFIAFLFLSGQIAPLSLMPPLVGAVAAVLPFRWLVSFPVELLLGRVSPAGAAVGVGMQVLWTGLAYGIFTFVWRRGVCRYSAVGT